jgi:hypothetical protein
LRPGRAALFAAGIAGAGALAAAELLPADGSRASPSVLALAPRVAPAVAHRLAPPAPALASPAQQPLTAYLQSIDRRMEALREGDDAQIEQLELELGREGGVSRAEKIAFLLDRLRRGAGARAAVNLLRALRPAEALGEVARIYRGTADDSLREAMHALFSSFVGPGAPARGAAETSELKAFFLDSALTDDGLTASLSLRSYRQLAGAGEAAELVGQIAEQWRAERAAGREGQGGALAGHLVASLAERPEAAGALAPVLGEILVAARPEERAALLQAVGEQLSAAPVPEPARSAVRAILQAAQPAPAPSADYVRWLEAAAAAQPGESGPQAASGKLWELLRAEREPLNVASAMIYADDALIARLSPSEVDATEAALDRWREGETDREKADFYGLALRRLDTARRLAQASQARD